MQRSCLFGIVPKNKPLLPTPIMNDIINRYVKLVNHNEYDLRCDDGNRYLSDIEQELNKQLAGAIGEGQVEHKRRDLLNTIIGYSEVLLDGLLGELNDEQSESVTYILAFARELLNLHKNISE